MDDKKKLGELRAGCSVDMTAPGTERDMSGEKGIATKGGMAA